MFSSKLGSCTVLDREINDKDIPSVLVDNFAAMEKAVQYLYDLGHRKIGFITFPFENQTTIRRRYEGYCSALKKTASNIILIS
jgi:DNA-binding LacI/PurR family transcriptional regulator